MKKLLALVLCLLMCFSLALGMTACGDEEKDDEKGGHDADLLVGEWVTELDSAEAGMDTEELIADLPEEFQNIDMPDLKIKLSYNFTDDGKVTFTMYSKSVNDWFDNLIDEMVKAGADRAELEQEFSAYHMEDQVQTKTYTVDDDKIVLNKGEDDESEMKFEVSEKKLTIINEQTTLKLTRK